LSIEKHPRATAGKSQECSGKRTGQGHVLGLGLRGEILYAESLKFA
jgi:hypothetical protein